MVGSISGKKNGPCFFTGPGRAGFGGGDDVEQLDFDQLVSRYAQIVKNDSTFSIKKFNSSGFVQRITQFVEAFSERISDENIDDYYDYHARELNQKYRDALFAKGRAFNSGMRDVVRTAGELSFLGEYSDRLDMLKQALKVTEELIRMQEKIERDIERAEAAFSDFPSYAFSGGRGSPIFDISPEINLRDDLREAIKVVKGLKQAAVYDFQALLCDAVRSAGKDDDGEFFVPHRLSYFVGQELESVGENKGAGSFYNIATRKAAKERVITQSMAYRLEELRVTAIDEPERVKKDILPEIAKIAENTPVMMAAILGNVSERDGVASGQFAEAFGTPDDIVKLDINAKRVSYIAVLSHLSQSDISSGERDEYTALQMKLEDELRDTAESLIGTATRDEVESLLFAFQDQVNIWTQKNGVIEEKLRVDGEKDARKYYAHLKNALDVYTKLAEPFLKDAEPGDPVYEKMATLSWQVRFDGQRSLDRPSDGLKDLSADVIPNFSKSLSISAHKRELCEEAGAAGVADKLFDAATGELNAGINISKLPEGISAGDRTRSAYMMPNSGWRSFGLPIAGGAVGYGIGLAAVATNPATLLLAGGGTGLAMAGNYIYDTRVRGAKAYEQTARTGLSRVSESEAWGYRKSYYLDAALMTTTVGIAPAGGTLVKGAIDVAGAGVYSLGSYALAMAASVGAEGGGVAGSVMNAVTSGGRAVMSGAGLIGKGIANMSGPAKFGFAAGSVGAGAMLTDYAFIDPSYNFKFGDGKIDTLVGNAGRAVLYGELIYLGFRFTWRKGTKTLLFRDGAMCDASTASTEFKKGAVSRTYKGFADYVEAAPYKWPAKVVHAGSYGMTADYHVVNKDDEGHYRFLDFDAPRNTLGERLAYDEQRKIDTPLGYAGAAAFLGPWAVSEFKNFPMALNNTRSARFARARTVAGLGLVALDGGAISTWYLGGLGGSLLANEAVASAVGVDAAASLVSTGIRVIWEWENQYVQNQPLHAPDAWRLVMASTESNVMRAPIKAFMRGKSSLNTFPAGQRLVKAHEWMEASSFAPIRALSRFRSLQGLASETVLMPGTGALREVKAKATPSAIIRLPKGPDGARAEHPAEMRILSNNGRGARFVVNGEEYVIQTGESAARLNGVSDKIVRVRDGATVQNEIGQLLKENNFYVRGGRLFRLEAQYLGQIRLSSATRQTVTPESLNSLGEAERTALLQRLGTEEQMFYDPASRKFYQVRMINPGNPTILSAHGKYNGGKISSDTEKIMPIKGKNGQTVWVKILREKKYFDRAELGGVKATLYTGSRSSPRSGPLGILYNVAIIPASAAALSSAVFAGTMSGDPVYQPAMRWLHYFVCETAIHPFIMWPLGMDTPLAQLVGRGVLTPIIAAEAKIFPTYRDSWPGVKLHGRRLIGIADDQTGNPVVDHAVTAFNAASSAIRFRDNGPNGDTAFKVFANDMFSSRIFPPGEDEAEAPAIRTYLGEENCMRDVLRDGLKMGESNECQELHPKTQKALKQELPLYDETAKERGLDREGLWRARIKNDAMEMRDLVEYERKGTESEGSSRLGTLQRKALVLKAALTVQTLRDVRESEKSGSLEIVKPYEDLQRDYPFLFGDNLYPRLDAPGKIDDFVKDLNRDEVPALKFSYQLDTPKE